MADEVKVIGTANDILVSVRDWANGKFVAKRTGYDLSKNDFTDALKSKLDGIAAGAQVNVIEGIKVNGESVSPVSKVVDITIPEAPIQGVQVNGTDLEPDEDGKVNVLVPTEADDIGAIPASEKGSSNGVATLGSDGKVPSSQLPSYVDDVIEGYYYNGKFYEEAAHTTEITPEAGKIYVDLSSNKTYRWGGTAYAEISASLALGETAGTAYEGSKGKANADAIAEHVADTANPHGVTKAQVGLGNVENKSAATILNELTKAKIAEKLGFTPAEEEHEHVVADITDLSFMTATEMLEILNAEEE